MTEYTIIHDGLYAFGVEGTAPNRFVSLRGFATELAAAAWISEQQAIEALVAAAAHPQRSPSLGQFRP